MTASGVAPGEPIKVGQVSIQYLIDLRPPSCFLPKLLRRHPRGVRPPWRCRNIPRDPDTPVLAATKLDLPFLRAATTPSPFLT